MYLQIEVTIMGFYVRKMGEMYYNKEGTTWF